MSKGHLYSPLKQRENALKELALESSVCVCVCVCVGGWVGSVVSDSLQPHGL